MPLSFNLKTYPIAPLLAHDKQDGTQAEPRAIIVRVVLPGQCGRHLAAMKNRVAMWHSDGLFGFIGVSNVGLFNAFEHTASLLDEQALFWSVNCTDGGHETTQCMDRPQKQCSLDLQYE